MKRITTKIKEKLKEIESLIEYEEKHLECGDYKKNNLYLYYLKKSKERLEKIEKLLDFIKIIIINNFHFRV